MSLEIIEKRLAYIEQGGRVQRMHMIPTLHSQNVAAHSFGVAWLVWELSQDVFEYGPSADLLMAALAHDLPEGRWGDIPAPTKVALGISRSFGLLEERADAEADVPAFYGLLSRTEQRILKLADHFELLMHCIREKQLGNRSPKLTEMFRNVSEYAAQYLETEKDHGIMAMFKDQWEEA